ncbi:MAG: PilZ domain-containing protein [Desulfofustis sp.]|nr:PilZ domain-containing protein [Desulfofustis sp.]
MSNGSQHLKVDADIGKNRLYFTIAGTIEKGDLDRLYTDTRFCVADLKPGFDVITDLSRCHLGHLSALPTFRKIMHYLVAHGVRNVVRIMNPDNLIHRQIVNFAARIPGYHAKYVAGYQEAEAALEQTRDRGDLRFLLPETPVILLINEQEETTELIDISVGGCAVKRSSATLPADCRLAVKLPLPQRDGTIKEFTIRSRLVKEFDDGIAIEFTELNDADRDSLRSCLVDAVQR